ncbi:hypothetical protein TNCV_3977731 [Trichonephila clavipes]|nr:hypothetical protein TNCV_3977731 [Trichonephila clavipes]
MAPFPSSYKQQWAGKALNYLPDRGFLSSHSSKECKVLAEDRKSQNYAFFSDFADVARIHLRRYKLDATGSLLPTKDGMTVTPSVWLALVR